MHNYPPQALKTRLTDSGQIQLQLFALKYKTLQWTERHHQGQVHFKYVCLSYKTLA